jgi:DNA-binding transcriptional LysR family regulator
MREPGSGTRAAVERHFAAHGLTIRAGGEFSTNEAIKQAVRAGLGMAVVSAQTIELELQTGCLAVLAVEGFPIVRHWHVVHRKHHRLSASATTFHDMLLALGSKRSGVSNRKGEGFAPIQYASTGNAVSVFPKPADTSSV